ncbi:MAG: aldo/keto reductase [Symbiobacteriaceae bacterium]|nr:aldo/keto reductase [Symbiobacteriaceae bacterium]
MVYRQIGQTDMKISALGFGCMRLPMTEKDGTPIVDDALTTPLLLRAVELGINFFDAHWFYCNYDCQRAMGHALASVRDQVYLSSKIQLALINKPADFREYLERSLEQMGAEYLDFYHFPALSYRTWQEKILPLRLIDEAEKAKAQGLLRHLSFSFHSDPDKMPELIDTGAFTTVLGQYNLVDRRNEEFFTYAKGKGVGTMVMGPLMGSVLTDGGETFLKRMASPASSAAEMGLRFVWSAPFIDVVLSGMNTLEQLETNVVYAQQANNIPVAERLSLLERSEELKSLNDLYCTNCNYCAGCPANIRIGNIFQLYLQHHIWGLGEAVALRLASYQPTGNAVPASACTACGQCLPRCPQGIVIPQELARVWEVLQGLSR